MVISVDAGKHEGLRKERKSQNESEVASRKFAFEYCPVYLITIKKSRFPTYGISRGGEEYG